jgi:hypothetical protein
VKREGILQIKTLSSSSTFPNSHREENIYTPAED